jgi:hypothetical protein
MEREQERKWETERGDKKKEPRKVNNKQKRKKKQSNKDRIEDKRRDMSSPVCVRMCLLSSDGLSNALPHTSHGRRVLSPRGGRDLGEGWRRVAQASWRSESSRSPAEDAAEDRDSPDTDLCSSVSPPLGGEEEFAEVEMRTRDNSDIDKSNGESATDVRHLRLAICCLFLTHFITTHS